MDSIMLIGSAGSVGHDMLYLMASMGRPMKVVGADFNEVKGVYEIEESLQIAHNLGLYPDFSFRKIDLFNIEQTAELINAVKPKVICNLASLGSWWITRLLPDSEYKNRPHRPMPNHLTLAYVLMQAVKMTGLDIKVVNGAFPDATNVVLSKVGLAPTCGGGNMDIGIQRLKRIIARDRKVPFQSVTIYGVGHHGTFYTARYNGPFGSRSWSKAWMSAKNIPMRSWRRCIARRDMPHPFSLPARWWTMKTAVSFLNNVLGIYYDTKKIHESVPAPEGLPGAYPARFSADGVQVVLPGISREQAIEINQAGGRIDGIKEIKEDGTVVYLDQNVQYMREVVGYECK